MSSIAIDGRPAERREECRIRIAAAGDIHYGERADDRERARATFAALEDRVDVILLAGDLTTHGEPEQAQIVADAVRDVGVPVLTVLGNHDWHVNRADDFKAVLQEAGVVVLDKTHSHEVLDICDTQVGIAGVKGFMGGFPGSHLPDFGEPSLRGVYRESIEEAEALDEGLRAIQMCAFRIVLMHYAPTTETLVGERETIWTFLGTDRLAPPLLEHNPDMVLHGHAHAGTFEGRIGEVPVYNVSVPVLGEDFWVFELTGERRRVPSEVH
ncbi:metallophosphoesterase [Solirubrobacter sp. CPCC 204708]|uniref:Metallophosphoesterase n=1 Tax=Solirubrobacter deserti TaxID=2282478 RepID=A0ABT4RQ93_9ACTN|nr:metallophosphoesterase [Solirubrobacter deserti]MBE2320484.1 metallophosphoesterase [Solirubrobacter deserti]MDA0140730.1 metallophosphoesterase [Solirubrobacter deserti]